MPVGGVGRSEASHSHGTQSAQGPGAAPSVRDVQQQLSSAGFNPGPVDGIMGPQTRSAIRDYQQANGLKVDGIVGPQTRGSLFAPQAANENPTVTDIQRELARSGFNPGPVDGVMGRRTERAVRAYQQAHQLPVDGVMGPQTRGSLFGAHQGHRHTDVFEDAAATGVRGPAGGSNREKLNYAMARAREMGLTITSTTGGRHAPRSYHYQGRAVDVAGDPSTMKAFYREMARLNPTELFHDPMGGIKRGRQIGAIGGHGRHVHVAF